jgi:hypothetical protein
LKTGAVGLITDGLAKWLKETFCEVTKIDDAIGLRI